MMNSLSLEALVTSMVHKALESAASSLQFEEGVIDSYNTNGTVVVALGPEKHLSGDIPFLTTWAGPNSTGVQAGHLKGSNVLVISMDRFGAHKFCIPGTWNEKNPAPGAPEGEYWVTQEKDVTYQKMKNDGTHNIAAKVKIVTIGPLTEITNNGNGLSDSDSIVRKSDLQKIVDHLNTNWAPMIKSPAYLLFGIPVVPNPTLLLGLLNVPAATASSVGRAQA